VRSICQLLAPGVSRAAIRDGQSAAEPSADLEPRADGRRAGCPTGSRNGERHLDVLKWGLIPYFTRDLKTARHPINARSDTVARSGMFKAAFAERRCLVPATAYYEWRDDPAGKTPFAIARLDGEPVVFGGIWEHWESADGHRLNTFATITTEANQQLSMIQPRMPVIIEKADWPVWLGEVEGDVLALLRPAPEDVLRLWLADKRVGNVKNNGPELLKMGDMGPEQPALL
jgi:putative SOS response-associated peptidase YedK